MIVEADELNRENETLGFEIGITYQVQSETEPYSNKKQKTTDKRKEVVEQRKEKELNQNTKV